MFFHEKLNSLAKSDIVTFIVVVLVASASFGLGRLSVLSGQKEPVTIEYGQKNHESTQMNIVENTESVHVSPPPAPAAAAAAITSGGKYVASKNGKAYYFPWCGTVSRIKEENKVWFNSEEEARKAGYEPAKNCKGMGE